MNPNPSCSHASEAHGGGGGHVVDEVDGGDNGADRKPTRAQLLHDPGSLSSIVNIGGVAQAGAAGDTRLENFGIMDHIDFDAYDVHQGGAFGGAGAAGVSLTLGLQQHSSHDGGVNIAFGAPQPAHHGGAAGYLYTAGGQMEGGAHPRHGHHVNFGAASIDGETPHGQEHYRNLSAGFHLLRDLAG
uniref:Uncharacterized protein n=1 Tax=Arundo donax TaxID=35708 RepID=A0A0A9I174_ARUDO